MVLFFQIFWAIGCIAWNMYGLYLISNGQHPIGPTASALVAGLCAVFALLFWWFVKRNCKWPYVFLSAATVVLAGIAVYGGFTKDASQWPSESWRWAGIVLNGTGMIAGITGIVMKVIKTN
jgi:hypothetical protein